MGSETGQWNSHIQKDKGGLMQESLGLLSVGIWAKGSSRTVFVEIFDMKDQFLFPICHGRMTV